MSNLVDKIDKIDDALQDAKTIFKHLSKDPSVLLFETDFKTARFTSVCETWTKVAGWSEQDALETTFFSFVHPEDMQETVRAWNGLVEVSAEGFINRYRTKDGRYAKFKWDAAQFDANGKSYSVVTFMGYED